MRKAPMLLFLSILLLAGCGGGAKRHFRKWRDEIRQMHVDDPEPDWDGDGIPDAPQHVIEALKDQDWCVRSRAALRLGEIGDRKTVSPLIEALKDENAYVRRNAAWALGKIGDDRAVAPLVKLLKDAYEGVRSYAGWSLQRITKQDFGEDSDKWRKWYEKNKDK